MRRLYPDDLSDEEWLIIEPILVNKKTKRGRKPKHSKRELLNAILYVLRTGCQWRHLPHDFPPWKSVYTQFLRWSRLGIFEELNKHLVKLARISQGRHPKASGAIIDSQSVKTTERGALEVMMAVRKLKDAKGIC